MYQEITNDMRNPPAHTENDLLKMSNDELKKKTSLKLVGHFKTFPKVVQKMKNLRALYFDDTDIETLPSFVCELPELRILHVGKKLTKLPPEIREMKQLKYLNLANSAIKTLPKEMSRLRNLKELQIQGTQITRLRGTLPEVHWQSLGGFEMSIDESLLGEFLRAWGDRWEWGSRDDGRVPPIRMLKVYTRKTIEDFMKKLKYFHDPLVGKKEFQKFVMKLGVISLSAGSENPETKIFSYAQLYNFFKWRKQYRINNTTQFFNKSFLNARMKNIPSNKRAIINTNSNVKHNGTVRRVYNKNGLNAYMRGKTRGRLYGGNFQNSNIKMLKEAPKVIVNKSVYMKNIKNRLTNVSLNNFTKEVEAIKKNLPQNVSRNDVNAIVKSMKKYIFNKIFNRLKNASPTDRSRLLNNFRKLGLINNRYMFVNLASHFLPRNKNESLAKARVTEKKPRKTRKNKGVKRGPRPATPAKRAANAAAKRAAKANREKKRAEKAKAKANAAAQKEANRLKKVLALIAKRRSLSPERKAQAQKNAQSGRSAKNIRAEYLKAAAKAG